MKGYLFDPQWADLYTVDLNKLTAKQKIVKHASSIRRNLSETKKSTILVG